MITGKDIYDVLTALVPLYVAMILAYGSVSWWKIFTREQCAGINRFVAVFAVPLLSFHFISSNNPYDMNYRYIAADSLQKLVVLILLFLWQAFFFRGSHSRDWVITLFSLSTLPNTLIMGIPLLKAMYGDFTTPLMVQAVVLQSVIWYTFIIIMFEYRSGKALIAEKFPDTAASIASFHVESSISSLDRHNSLEVDTEIADGGRLHVVLRRHSPSLLSSYGENSIGSMTPYAPALSNAEIYSLQSSPVQSCTEMNVCGMVASRMMSPRSGYVGNCDGEAHSIMLSSASSNSEGGMEKDWNRKRRGRSMGGGGMFSSYPGAYDSESVWRRKKEEGWENKGLHMFVWSASDSSLSDSNFRHAASRDSSTDFGALDASSAVPPHIDARRGFQKRSEYSNFLNKIRKNREIESEDDHQIRMTSSAITRSFLDQKVLDTPKEERKNGAPHQMPPSCVMTKLILIMVWRKLIRNPNTYASIIGIVWSLISFRWNIEMPSIVKGSISILSDTGLGMAMFSLGLFMALQTKLIACGKSAAASSMAVRFLVGPAIMAGTSAALGIRGVLLQVSIVQAALPQGIVPFVFAMEYDCHADILSTGVIFGMVIALPITIIYYILLGL